MVRKVKSENILNLIISYEYKRFFYKSLLFNTVLPSSVRVKAANALHFLSKQSSLSYLQLRCVFSGRSRALLTQFRQSRISFRTKFAAGYLVGLRKSSS